MAPRKGIAPDDTLVAYCGLYCGACRAYLKGKCPGCHQNSRASWCKVRTCCVESRFFSCADCTEFDDASDCAKFNTIIAKLFSLLLRSDRAACIRQIRALGISEHAAKMAESGRQAIKK